MKKRGLYLLLAVAGAALALSASAGADQSYNDPTGDAGVGTDIAMVTVGNSAAGLLSIKIVSVNPVVTNHIVAVFINSDRNGATGDRGDDYFLFAGPAFGAHFLAWNGSDWAESTPGDFTAGITGGNTTEIRFGVADIGNPKGFDFWTASAGLDGNDLNVYDAAPDAVYWSYDLVTTPTTTATTTTTSTTTTTTTTPKPAVKPVIRAPLLAPAVPKAGKRLTVSFRVTRSDNGMPLKTGKMICDPKIAGKLIAHVESFTQGTAKLSLVVPKTAKGKVLTVKVTIKAGGQTATRTARITIH